MALLCQERFRKGAVHICWRLVDGWQHSGCRGRSVLGLVLQCCSSFSCSSSSFSLGGQAVSSLETAWWTVCHQDSLSAARADHWWWSVWQTPIRLSSYLFFGVPLSRWPVESLPYSTIFGRWCSYILKLYPSHLSCVFSNMASVLVTAACSRTSMLVMNSLQWMFRIESSTDRSAQVVVDGDDRWPMTQSCTGG